MSKGGKEKTLRQAEFVKVPIRVVNGEKWGNLSVFGKDHEFCGTRFRQLRDISFLNQHGTRLIELKQMVHWRIPTGTELDISDVNPDRRRAVLR